VKRFLAFYKLPLVGGLKRYIVLLGGSGTWRYGIDFFQGQHALESSLTANNFFYLSRWFEHSPFSTVSGYSLIRPALCPSVRQTHFGVVQLHVVPRAHASILLS
jgi:hypothetical protein